MVRLAELFQVTSRRSNPSLSSKSRFRPEVQRTFQVHRT
jgi:hypothetical protein